MSRVGNFSSSSIYKLIGNGRTSIDVEGETIKLPVPMITYIKEKVRENRLKRSISTEHNAKPTSWGHLVEPFAFERLGLKYTYTAKERYYHKKLAWSGMPDMITDESQDIVGDIKCPWTLNAFCDLADSISQGVEAFKENHKEYYWQLVSNAVLSNRSKAVIVCYCPYKEDLEDIKDAAFNSNESNQQRFMFAYYAQDNELPYLEKGGYYKDVNILEFDIPNEDKEELTERVTIANKILEAWLK